MLELKHLMHIFQSKLEQRHCGESSNKRQCHLKHDSDTVYSMDLSHSISRILHTDRLVNLIIHIYIYSPIFMCCTRVLEHPEATVSFIVWCWHVQCPTLLSRVKVGRNDRVALHGGHVAVKDQRSLWQVGSVIASIKVFRTHVRNFESLGNTGARNIVGKKTIKVSREILPIESDDTKRHDQDANLVAEREPAEGLEIPLDRAGRPHVFLLLDN